MSNYAEKLMMDEGFAIVFPQLLGLKPYSEGNRKLINNPSSDKEVKAVKDVFLKSLWRFWEENIKPMRIFLLRLKKNKIDYLVIGGIARHFHRIGEVTKDLDLLFKESDRKNVVKIAKSVGFRPYQQTWHFVKLRYGVDLMFLPEKHFNALLKGCLHGRLFEVVGVKYASQSALERLRQYRKDMEELAATQKVGDK